jgi:hypothetical protein
MTSPHDKLPPEDECADDAELRSLEESQAHREHDSQETAERNDRDNERDRLREREGTP